MGKRKIKIGEKYGRLTVIEDTGKRNLQGEIIYNCICECGNSVYLRSSSIGRTQSCGCRRDDLFRNGTYLPAIKINKPPKHNNNTGHVGVTKLKNGLYYTRIKLFGRNHYLGTYKSYDEACAVREAAEQKYFAPAITNLFNDLD